MNVIVTDWSAGAMQLYMQAVGNCRLVGKQVSYLLEHLEAKFGLRCSKIHLIGHSLGAHIAGYAGENLRKKHIVVRRISGMCFILLNLSHLSLSHVSATLGTRAKKIKNKKVKKTKKTKRRKGRKRD